MDLDLLRTFVAVCDAGSFTAAARQVGRTQSAVSLQMRRLETSLGRPLLVRGGAMPSDYAPRVLPEVLRGFAELYPEGTIDIVLDRSRALVRRLAEGSVDLAFVSAGEGPVRRPAAFEDRLVWVAPAEGDLHHRDPLPAAIWEEGGRYEEVLAESLRAMNRAHRVAVVSRHIIGLRAAVTTGLAVAVMVGSGVVAGMRVLGPGDGFQELRGVAVHLETTHQRRSPMVDRLAAHLLERLRGSA